MGQTTGFLTKSFKAVAATPPRRIVKFGGADGTGEPATAATDKLVGISSEIATEIGENGTVFMVGNIVDVEYGGTVARGDMLTSDATGRAISTTTAGNRYIGIAEVSGVVGDIGTCIITPGLI